MNTKRVVVATIIGTLCGLFCAYGTVMKLKHLKKVYNLTFRVV